VVQRTDPKSTTVYQGSEIVAIRYRGHGREEFADVGTDAKPGGTF
jgi:hypothetical protein